jgi:outer membrane receptor for ferric coprogen and ferric-rhodotorulic acid
MLFTPRTGLTWLFTENISLYASVMISTSKANRTNNRTETVQATTGYDMETGMKVFSLIKNWVEFFFIYMVKNNTVTRSGDVGYYIQKGQ